MKTIKYFFYLGILFLQALIGILYFGTLIFVVFDCFINWEIMTLIEKWNKSVKSRLYVLWDEMFTTES